MHPLPIMMNNGVPISLNSDDPSVFGNMGLTYDFFQVRSFPASMVLSTVTHSDFFPHRCLCLVK